MRVEVKLEKIVQPIVHEDVQETQWVDGMFDILLYDGDAVTYPKRAIYWVKVSGEFEDDDND